MCELFAITSQEKVGINSYLKEFQERGIHHPHGWGMAIFLKDEIKLYKEAISAVKSEWLNNELKNEIYVKNMIAHIRFATKGNEAIENTHPFIKEDKENRKWILAHNGTIFESPILEKYVFLQDGQTDSERILWEIIDRINAFHEKKMRRLTDQERFSVMDDLVYELSFHNKLNLLIWDGQYLYVHTNYKNSLFRKKIKTGFVFATMPLDQDEWESVPFCQLLVYQEGKEVFRGKNRTSEYIENPEDLKFLYLDNSFL